MACQALLGAPIEMGGFTAALAVLLGKLHRNCGRVALPTLLQCWCLRNWLSSGDPAHLSSGGNLEQDRVVHHENRWPMMQRLLGHFNRVHLTVFLGFYVTFAALTFLTLNAGSESDRRDNWIAAATIGAVSGPFTGAIARHFQSCCLQFSISLFPICAFFLAVGVLFQVIPLPFQRFVHATRLTFWCVGLLGWFGGVLASFLHALS